MMSPAETPTPPKPIVPLLICDIRDDAYTHGYIDALTHLATTLNVAAELDKTSDHFGKGLMHAARIVTREAQDLVKSKMTLTEPR